MKLPDGDVEDYRENTARAECWPSKWDRTAYIPHCYLFDRRKE